MSNKVESTISTGKMKFTFTDEDGEVFSAFRLNPSDVNLAKRCQEVAEQFGQQKDRQLSTIEDAVAYNTELEEKILYILGYDAKAAVFGEVSATTVLPSGELFAAVVLDTIAKAVEPEIRKRNQKMTEAVAKYTGKYE